MLAIVKPHALNSPIHFFAVLTKVNKNHLSMLFNKTLSNFSQNCPQLTAALQLKSLRLLQDFEKADD